MIHLASADHHNWVHPGKACISRRAKVVLVVVRVLPRIFGKLSP